MTVNVPLHEIIRRNHISRLGWALFMSDHWYNSWLDYKGSIHPNMRGFALMCKAKSMVNFDRVICS